MEIVHRPIQTGTVGKIDGYGYGSWAKVWDYPTLGLKGIRTINSASGPKYPLKIRGVEWERPEGCPEYLAPECTWGGSQWSPEWRMSDGSVIRPKVVDGQKCFVETRPESA